MQYFTRLTENPSLATCAMLDANPLTQVEVVALADRFGRTVAVRTIGLGQRDFNAVCVCAGDNPVYVANVIALAHAHNLRIKAANR